MSNEQFIPLISSVKDKDGKQFYCCAVHWLVAHRHVSTGKLAAAWGLSRSTVKNWRRKKKLGELKCPGNHNCRLARGSQCSVLIVDQSPL